MILPFISKLTAPNLQPHPQKDWFFLLVVGGVGLILSAGWNLYVFSELASGKSLGGTLQKPKVTQSVQITDVQQVFKSRAIERDHYQNDYTFVDPSLPGS